MFSLEKDPIDINKELAENLKVGFEKFGVKVLECSENFNFFPREFPGLESVIMLIKTSPGFCGVKGIRFEKEKTVIEVYPFKYDLILVITKSDSFFCVEKAESVFDVLECL